MNNFAIHIDVAAIDKAVAAAAANYAERNPNSQAQYVQATEVMPGGNTRSVLFYTPFPLAIVRGEGCRLWDADGHEYLDFIAEFTAGIYGHSNPVIRAAIDGALDKGINLSGHNLLESRLARMICERFPSVDAIRFTNSGTEANLMAIATAKVHTRRAKIIVFKGGYHGGVLTFAAGGSPVNVPHEYLIANYNDLESVRTIFETYPEDVAAVVVEAMQGASGCILGKPAFLAGLREMTTAYGALLVFDEVMTSRLAPGGLQQTLGIHADLTTLGKYIGGGMSFGAFGGRRDLMDQFDPRNRAATPHAGTFNNNVLTMAAGAAGLAELYTPAAARELNAMGDQLRRELNAMCTARRVPMQFIGTGSLMNLQAGTQEIRSVSDLDPNGNILKDLFFFHMIEQGIYIARRGFIVLSLPITPRETGRMLRAVEGFIDRYESVLKPVAP
ncbi:aminotransferase class III-fold pyridoxal phosphate-dependent enzyme [Cupriavidus pauculus]|uniref:Aminotransferase class III-fold pyridoxal phosphate-dependent enzyme n=1 Tax=Cupriavidus pauculus TaxID=82633 RepID=A0A5P2H9A0_9BURK|nr:aminotransferase class III-fold pyridoxal phosphate-dependent enzyme [Cupriavidus pauculus]QET04661.1 aminotransferase class III-fold pyridoxal phosphate-dependent enzyme [Cupriavidus pauculus]